MNAFDQGYAAFHRGKVPENMPRNRGEFMMLSKHEQEYITGYNTAREDVRAAFLGEMPASTRPMRDGHDAVLPMGEISHTMREVCRKDALRSGVVLSIPKAPRRKGRRAITLRYNGEGVSITWQGMFVRLDDMPQAERGKVVANIAALAAA